jgi:subtilisin family serine protease
VWAVIDSGVDKTHRHFQRWGNLDLPIAHQDFTGGEDPFADEFGHGTHVAGIIAGELLSQPAPQADAAFSVAGAPPAAAKPIRAVNWQRDESGNVTARVDESLKQVSGMAPKCKILSLKVLGKNGTGNASNLIAALAYIQEINGYGRRILIHGTNMSVGYGFEPRWFACGQSPLCVEVDKLVRSGVIVVAAAGNTGYGTIQPEVRGPSRAGYDITINDPGNAELAITVGSTHRDMPHTYGVSYFSSKGPTGDGRLKPDLVAPGEKILSCAAGNMLEEARKQAGNCEYLEHSGTSMAAPHVSGVIAAFLSVRREFIGQPERVKEIFLSSAVDLKRERYFQGHGLVDLMRAIQSV